MIGKQTSTSDMTFLKTNIKIFSDVHHTSESNHTEGGQAGVHHPLVNFHNHPNVGWIDHIRAVLELVGRNQPAQLVVHRKLNQEEHYHKKVQHHLGSHSLHCFEPVVQCNLVVKMGMIPEPLEQNQDPPADHNLKQAGHLAGDTRGQILWLPEADYTHQ